MHSEGDYASEILLFSWFFKSVSSSSGWGRFNTLSKKLGSLYYNSAKPHYPFVCPWIPPVLLRRTYEKVCAIRCVQTTDYMTADWYHMPYDVLGKISNRYGKLQSMAFDYVRWNMAMTFSIPITIPTMLPKTFFWP